MNSESGPADEVAIKEKSRVVNPYLRSSTNPLRIQVNPPKQPAMGLNSKQRVGAIKASKRFGSERNKLLNKKKKTHKKNSLGVSRQGSSIDPVCFNPKRHCVVCRAVSLGCAKPHRAHHELCNRNTATKGRVLESFLGKTSGCELALSQTKKNNSIMPPMMLEPLHQTTHDATTGRTVQSHEASKDRPKGNPKEPDKNFLRTGVEPSLGRHLRQVLEAQYAALHDVTSDKHEKLTNLLSSTNKTLPSPIALLFAHITDFTQITRRPKQSTTTNRSESTVTLRHAESLSQRYKYFPPGTCIFSFPSDPSPHPFPPYHSIEGMSIFSLDWESMFPDIVLPACMEPGCDGKLSRDRTNFSKNKTLFPVFIPGGLPMWGSIMVYKCKKCSSSFNANDGCFLARLDDHISSAYPVEPRYALCNYRFHLSIDVTEDLESTMLTNGSGDSFSKKMHRSQCNKFKRVIRTYASKAHMCKMKGGTPDEWTILFEAWNGKFVPSGIQLRSYYLDGDKSPLTPYGYSNQERYKRELQQVGRNMTYKAAAIDWTFQVLKTYISLPGAKACFTLKVSDGQMAGVAIVRSTAVAEISHFLIQLILKRCMKVQILYTDLWPSGEIFWKNIFGSLMIGRLGLFHAMKRITDTFRKAVDPEFLQDAMNDLKRCFYSHDPDDLSKLYAALKNGSMSQQGYKYSDVEVQCLEKSRYWSQQYGKFLKKKIHQSPYIEQRLLGFISKWKPAMDEKSKKLFTDETEKTIRAQLKNVAHVSDPPTLNMYREVKAGPSSKHGLSEWHSLRMESQLEKGHHLMAHYGNTGMGTELADSLILRGITETNTKIRFKTMKKNPSVPSHLEDTPFYWDSSELAYINERMRQASLKPVFLGIQDLPPDNGEVFLSEYYFQQNERQNKHNQPNSPSFDARNNKCNCPNCEIFCFPLTKASRNNSAISAPDIRPVQTTNVHATAGEEHAVLAPADPQVTLHPVQATQHTVQTVPTPNQVAPGTLNMDQNLGQHAAPHCAHTMTARNMPPPTARHNMNQIMPAQAQGVGQINPHSIRHASIIPPFFVTRNVFTHLTHANSPPQHCFAYAPYYCPARLTWISQCAPTFWSNPPPHNRGCPGRRPRGPVMSPFLNMNSNCN